MDKDEFINPTNSEVCNNAKLLATVLQNFQKCWCHEYLTSISKVHKSTGNNCLTVGPGDVVLIHGDKPHITWKMGIVKDLMTTGDGIV